MTRFNYQYCYECDRAWPTARSLRKAYRRQFWKATGSTAYQPRMPWIRRLWRVITVRARTIYFCQECLHDFMLAPKTFARQSRAT